MLHHLVDEAGSVFFDLGRVCHLSLGRGCECC